MESFRERVKVIDNTLLNLEQFHTILSHVSQFFFDILTVFLEILCCWENSGISHVKVGVIAVP